MQASTQDLRLRGRQPRKSLRAILISWFLGLSIIPTVTVTGISIGRFEEAINTERVQRLRANVREFINKVSDFEKYLAARRVKYQNDSLLQTYLSTNSYDRARQHILSVSRNTALTKVNLFNRDGDSIASFSKEEIDGANPKPLQEFSLKEDYMKTLSTKNEVLLTSFYDNSMELTSFFRVNSKNGKPIGYIEEIISIEPGFLESLKNRLNLEVILFDDKGKIISSSHPDFSLYPKDFFAKTIVGEAETFIELPIRNEPYDIMVSRVAWGDNSFLVGIGASKQRTKAVLKKVNLALLSVIALVIFVSILLSLIMARIILKPLNDLLAGIENMDTKDGPVAIPVKSNTEIGILAESFNDLSQRVFQTKKELENKVREKEEAYKTLQETQARLVHSAKMASLGQLVAGVAHELNNPIGFIYANMAHLKDYSDRLTKIIENAEKNPKQLETLKEELEYDYVIKDLPRLIKSCEDGARRTRDIVLGLRNFSRLEEATLKSVKLQESIESTLQMISGELKNRIKVHTDYQPMPEVMCFASELNQVFMNLLTNAAQAIEGEGEIFISIAEKRAKPEPLAEIKIRDTGRGMASSTLEKIFDPFFTTKSVGEGTGLGLSITYGIIKKHNGEITVKSEVGKGTEFTILIPIAGPPKA